MKAKYILIYLSLLIISTSLFAQNSQTRVESHRGLDTTRVAGGHDVGWMHSPLLDNWYLQLQGGPHVYIGHEDNLGPFLSRITPNAELWIGRWLFPVFGYRVGGGLTRSVGYLSKETYNTYHPSIGYGESEGLSPNALGGYYWSMEDHPDLYIQKWTHAYFGGDVIINFSYSHNSSGQSINKKWQNMLYLGFIYHAGLSEDHPQVSAKVDPNTGTEGRIGYMGQFKIDDNWSGYIDARFSVIDGTFDRELQEQMELFSPDLMPSIQVGLNYGFNFRSEATRRRDYIRQHIISDDYPEDAKLPQFFYYVQVEEVEQVTLTDTIIKYTTVINDDLTNHAVVDSLRDVIDSIIYIRKHRADNQPLDSIFLKNLLPYEMVFFELDKWDIPAREEIKLDRMARIIKAYPNEKFILTGSADSKTGTPKRNDFLSRNRADVVYNKLVMEYDVNPDQLEREYLGGIADYKPFELNRATVIIIDHPTVKAAFQAMKSQGKAGGGVVETE